MMAKLQFDSDVSRCIVELRANPKLVQKINLSEPSWTWPVQMMKYDEATVKEAVRIARGE